ncbi:DsbA family protein [Patescibacteria group bacterium]
MEEGLTKKEKRALAKNEKKKERDKESVMKYFKYVVFGLVIVFLGYFLFRPSTNTPTGSNDLQDKFVEYAAELGLDETQFRSDTKRNDLETKVLSDLGEANSLGLNSTPTFFVNGEKVANPGGYDEFKSLIEEKISDEEVSEVEVKENDHTKGSPEAKVILVEYSDFQCPACGAYAAVLSRLSEEIPEDLLIIYRHFPLSNIHTNARAAAIASEAAAQQGKFWEYHDLLFTNQPEWSKL